MANVTMLRRKQRRIARRGWLVALFGPAGFLSWSSVAAGKEVGGNRPILSNLVPPPIFVSLFRVQNIEDLVVRIASLYADLTFSSLVLPMCYHEY